MKKALLVSVFFLASCANPKHTAVVADNTLYEVLNDTFNIEQALLKSNTPQWTLQRSQAFNKQLLPAIQAGRQFNIILKNWKSGQPIPVELHDAITGITEALKQITLELPDGSTKTKILSNLANAESIVLTALDLVLALKGA